MAEQRMRVVITGIGAVTPLGNDLATSWQHCRDGVSGIAPIFGFESADLETRIAGQVKDFDPAALLGRKEARRTARNVQFAVAAAREAVAMSGFDIAANAEDVGVCMASGVGGLEWLENAVSTLVTRGPDRISPFTVPSMIADMAAGVVAIDLGAKGPNFAVVSACASGAHAIGEAAEWIRRGDATAVLAGGTEAGVVRVGVSSFNAMQALSRRNDEPTRASRPFDRTRDGFVIAEGAAVMVLESYEAARARGATILAEVAGYGATADASHITAPDPVGDGARRCVLRALARTGRPASDVAYINAHGTSTQLNDAAETKAIKAAFGEDLARSIPMSSTKSMTGHLLGAAGAVEAAFTVMAIRDSYAPPTINLEEPDPDCDLDYIPNVGRAMDIPLAISTSFGFGGHNACLALARVED